MSDELVGDQRTVGCSIVRGGTSKGVFIPRSNLPEENQDAAILSLFGSPDDRQIDGLGGATSTTSKLMIVSPSEREGIDIDYTFGQVAVEESVVDYGGNCGNLTCAIGSFAVDEGMVSVTDGDTETTIELYNTNTDAEITQTVPLVDGRAASVGDFKIHGVPGTGAQIDTTFHDPAGAMTDGLFPLGGPTIDLDVDGEEPTRDDGSRTEPTQDTVAEGEGVRSTDAPVGSPTGRDYVALFRDRRFTGFVLVTVGVSFAHNGLVAFLPLYLSRVSGITTTTASLLYSLFFWVTFVQLVTGDLSDRVGRFPMMVTTGGLAAAAMWGIVLVPRTEVVVLGALIAAIGVGAHGFQPVRGAYLMKILPDRLAGGGLGAVRTVLMGAGALAPGIVGIVADISDFRVAFGLLAAAMALSAAGAAGLWVTGK